RESQWRAVDEEQLLSCYVELAHLQHDAREYQAALASCDAALKRGRHYAPAHRRRAEALLALGDYAAAGQALDDYLALVREQHARRCVRSRATVACSAMARASTPRRWHDSTPSGAPAPGAPAPPPSTRREPSSCWATCCAACRSRSARRSGATPFRARRTWH